jgi:hypothetical protein
MSPKALFTLIAGAAALLFAERSLMATFYFIRGSHG